MPQVRSVDFLPEIFQTDANKQFLAATLDQLVQEPKFKKTQGFIGRKVGPGVNPNDRYVLEPTKTRSDYQLETGVVSLDPANTNKIQDAITYPGITDALEFQGADGTRPDRLYSSEYYSWDPFINFDTFINSSQYYWLPDGPPVVSVFTDAVPLSQNFAVTRSNGVYTFSGQNTNNPTIELVRGGTYTFQVANNDKETVNFRVTNSGTASYQIDYLPNPTLTLARGNTYVFTLNMTAEYPFWIKTEPITGTGSAYSSGVTNNGGRIGTVIFTVPQDAPSTLYYSAQNNTNMHGQINIVDSAAGTGPGFWIQTSPGVTGRSPTTPNLSTRDVLGVANNGEDLGTVTFTVPSKTAQNFYYTLPDLGGIDLLTNLRFDQINNVGVTQFIAQYGGIDGITNLDGRTLVFLSPYDDDERGGWILNSVFDPLAQNSANNSLPGSYDSLPYAYSTYVPLEQRRSVWQINYVTVGNYTYMQLRSISSIDTLEKFYISYGKTYSNTQWYKNDSGYFEQIPLLSAVLDTLYYQDGTDPEIFGRIKLLEPAEQTILNVDDIIGQATYTSPSNTYYPNGVTFTNGLKVKFIGNVVPESYWSGTIAVNCYATVSGINFIECDTTQGLSPGQTITFADPIGGLEENTTYYIKKVFSTTQFTVSVTEDGTTVTLTDNFGEMTGTMVSDKQYYVAGVGTSIELLPVKNFVVPETYASDADTETVYIEPSDLDYITVDRASKDLNAWTRSNRWFHSQVLTDTGTYNRSPIDTSLYQKALRPIIEFRPGFRLYNMGTEGKNPVNVIDFVETDALSNIEGAVEYTSFTTPIQNILPTNFVIDTPYKITRLGSTDWNAVAGTSGVDYEVGSTFTAAATGLGSGLATPGYKFVDNSKVVFAADTDPNVRNTIYVVNFVVPNSVPETNAGDFKLGARYTIVDLGNTDWNEVADTIGVTYEVGQTLRAVNAGSGTGTATFAEPIINLVPAIDGTVLVDQCTVCLSGSQQGLTYWYDGVSWILAQQKTKIQQQPLFNVYDGNGVSLDNQTSYPSSTFAGTKLFSYAVGSGLIDSVLKFQLKYQTLNNVGDILFDNNLYADKFTYVVDTVTYTKSISIGCPREYTSRTDYARLLGWQTAVVPSFVRQQFKFSYDGLPLLLDVKVLSDQVTIVPAVKVYVGSVFQHPSTYTVTTTADTTTISFVNIHVIGDIVEVQVLSDQVSQSAFYQVPMNLSQNPLNKNSDAFTLGTIRTHYETICENLTSLVGPINGQNNTRDLGNLIPYGQLILQQSSPMTLSGYFMRSQQYNIFAALEYNSREYQKYKNQMLEAVTRQNIDYNISTAQLLDTVIMETVRGRTSQNPFYWSDMLPATETYTTTTYTLSCTSTDTIDTVYFHNYTTANYYGMNVYFNGVLLVRGVDYSVGIDSATITILPPLSTTLQDNDVLVIQEYAATYGTFVPNTPTKMGLYPAWRPGIIPVKTSKGTSLVILGHDGSQTPVFNDIRDQVLLEFETRIYNNLKLDGNPVPLTISDVLPGQFRNTGFSYDEINAILSESLLTYVGWNKLDYTTQNYNASNTFTFNYSQSLNKLDNKNLLGAWRGIYRYFYDVQQPEETPWEMLGFTIKPEWWEITYGPVPYTRDNQVLWDDLEAGLVRDPLAPYIIPKYARPGLSQVLPTGSEGELLAPLDSVVGIYGENTFKKSWVAGDGGPVEASWWNSSDYPFAVMRLLSLTRPAEFFALFADRDLYRFNDEFQQYLYDNRYRLDANSITVYGNGTSKASYINWIVDYNKILGQESTTALQNDLANLDVRLCYRMASFSDKQYIKLYTEKSTPSSTNTSFLIPDESYDLLLYKNQPFDRSIYSSVVIQVVESGWAVYGYSTTRPYFSTLTSLPTGQFRKFTVGNNTVQVPTFYTETVANIPYGFVFTTQDAVANFLLTYGKYLEQSGFTFTDRTNGYVLDWDQMVQEFMYWVNQGWGIGSLINLNPLSDRLSVTKEQAIVDSIQAQTAENIILDQNRREFSTKNLNIVRLDNTFTIESLNDQTISYIDMRYTSYENMIVLNNSSLFGDLIYDPVTGARQYRLKIVAATSTEWNGSVNAPGFVLNQDNIEEWTGLKTYPKGELVKYKGKYWSAATIVQPSIKFDYNSWNQSDYTQIELGLLPNIANKANQLANSYNINSANLESDNDLLSYGLIGFRPRQYMTDLNLDDVSQLNVYRQFIDTKGTTLSTDLFSNTEFGKDAGQYTIYENWALQRSVYGANANRNFFDLRLDKQYLTSDPALVQIIVPQQPSQADQTIMLSDVWKSSFVLTTPDILPTTTTTVTDIGLPSAGYVNLDDVDITVFQLTDPASLSANLGSIHNGSSVWVAKVNDYDWNIYRTQSIAGSIQHVCDNLDGTSRVIFSNEHGLSVGDQLIIRFFDVAVDGVYKVLGVVDINTVNIAFTFDGGRTVANGNGIGFKMQTMRVAQASDVSTLPYTKQILPGARVWVDDDGQGRWEVLEKQDPFVNRKILRPVDTVSNEEFGASITQDADHSVIFVGSPALTSGGNAVGGIYVYVNTSNTSFVPDSPVIGVDVIVTLAATGVRGFGNSVDFGNKTWAAAGASKSLGPNGEANNGYAAVIRKVSTGVTNIYSIWQLLTMPGTTSSTTPGAGEFGYSVVVSDDERWIYVGAPGLNEVYAYGRVDADLQSVLITASEPVTSVDISDSIQIDNSLQLTVTLNGVVLTPGTDYQVSGDFTTVTFTTPVVVGTNIIVARVTRKSFAGGTSTYSLTPYFFTVDNINSFTVTVDNQTQRPGIDYTFSSGNLVFVTATPAQSTVIVNAEVYFEYVDTLTVAGIPVDARFGHSVKCSTDGRQVIVGARNDSATGTIKTIGSSGVAVRGYKVFNDVTPYSTSGSGSSSKFDVTCYNNSYIVTIADPGSNYAINDSILIRGSSIGGVDIVNDLTITVSEVATLTEAGSVYVFDRNVQAFIKNDDSSNTYTVLGTPVAPISVLVNNQFLTNEQDGIVGATNTFVVSGNNITINATLNVGDVIEIETNQFALAQKVVQDTVSEFVNFGQAVDLCPYNCSLYVGAPQDNTTAWKGGIVQRSVAQARTYGTITATMKDPDLVTGDTIRINNIDISVPAAPNNTVSGLKDAINGYADGSQTGVPNVQASINSRGYLTISAINTSAPFGNKLQVSPGTIGNTFTALGFETFVYTQTIESPLAVDYAAFGSSLSINDTALGLVVGAPKGTLYLPNTFDYSPNSPKPATTFDGNSTTFYSPVQQSGAVYTYDYLPSSVDSIDTPGMFTFGQQVSNTKVRPYDQYGTSFSYGSGVLIIGAPGNDNDVEGENYGAAFAFENPTLTPAWTVIHQQQPVVDIRLINSVFMYDRITSERTEFFDFFDPLQGKILGAAQQNLDYIGAVDPASYNVGYVNNRGNTWGAEHVGEMWWDISSVRFIDTNQDNIVYASRRWGQLFPGSTVNVYQWVESTTPPTSYVGSGTPLNNDSYVISTRLNNTGLFSTTYYFWVKDVTETYTQDGKTLSASVVAQYIESPKASGIAYIAPINSSTIAIYNGLQYIDAADTIISIEFDKTYTDANVHAEYELIAQGRPDAFMSDMLYRKFQDSLCGADSLGNQVPDPSLPVSQRYGVQFRPRQSMFTDRFLALKNYITRANSVLKLYPISETRSFTLLNSQEPIPPAGSGAWNYACANLEILGYQNIYQVPLGYIYLVESDSDYSGFWTTYTVKVDPSDADLRILQLTRIQSYKTNNYWSYIDWYLPGYNPTTKVSYEVPNYVNLKYLGANVGASAKVTANAQGKWEIYLLTDLGWERVGLQDGTIEISAMLYNYGLGDFGYSNKAYDTQPFDYEPQTETRKIIQAINEQLFVDELLIERNKALTLMFNFILSELQAPEWLVKTSLIDVNHVVRQLLPFPNYVQDNQYFVSDYLQEVKPYHVQVREFNLVYNGEDEYPGDVTDFDVPAYYNADLLFPQYVSPILLPYAHATAQEFNTVSDTPLSSVVWSKWPYTQWISNYTLSLESIKVVNQGSGYTDPPVVTIEGDAVVPATAIAIVNSIGNVVSIIVTDPGSGYTETPTVVFDSALGSGAVGYPVMTNGLVRSFKTIIKYDRCEFNSSIIEWSPDGTYENGTRVRHNDAVWSADSSDGSSAVVGPTFELNDWVLVPAGDLNAADRTMGYYVPGINMPGLELPLLIDGISYPGVQVFGPNFTQHEDQITVTIEETIGIPPGSSNIALNLVVCDTTELLVPGMPISFTGTVFGNIVTNHLYYVFRIVDPTKFTISLDSSDEDQVEFELYSSQWVQVPASTWNISNSYAVNDVVYAPNGSIRQAIREVTTGSNISIDNTLYWNEYPIAYRQNSVVTFEGKFYTALIDVPPSISINNPSYWEEIVNPTPMTGTVLVPEPLDAIYASYFGVRNPDDPSEYTTPPNPPYPSDRLIDINVEGGKFVDAYEGHAPEELVNGSEFDTMDFKVYTRSGSDWQGNGHGFAFRSARITYLEIDVNSSYSWKDIVEFPMQLVVSNITTKTLLIPDVNYTVDWINQTISIVSGVSFNDVFDIAVYQAGGGNQLYQAYYSEKESGDSIVVPAESSLIESIVLFVNGQPVNVESWNPYYAPATEWDVTLAYNFNDVVYSQAAGTASISGTTLSVSEVTSGVIAYGTEINGIGIAPGTIVVGYIGGSGNTGTYTVNNSQTVASVAFTGQVIYYHAIAQVPIGIVLNNYQYWQSAVLDPETPPEYYYEFTGAKRNSVFELPSGITATDGVSVLVMGYTTPTQYNWSVPVTQYIVADLTIRTTRILYPTNSLEGTNPANLIVNRNGLRLTPPGGIEWIGDGSTTAFALPDRIGPQSGINDEDVQVWVDNVLQEQGTDYSVSAWDGSTVRQVEFDTAPDADTVILISVSTYADYTVTVGETSTINLNILPNVGDVFGITTFNDTTQQELCTLVFNGPVQTGYVDVEPYSSTDYSPLPEASEWDTLESYDINAVVFTQVYESPGVPQPGNLPVFYKALQSVPSGVNISNPSYWEVITLYPLPESYDYSMGYEKDVNQFFLNRSDINSSRLWVTLDGNYLFDGVDFTIEGQYLILASGVITAGQILAVTEFTDSVTPNPIAFRIFQDMRGVQITYRITQKSTAIVSQEVLATDETIFVDNLSDLTEPNLPNGVFGVVTINGERIMYRNRDFEIGAITGLFRGTAGTGAANHAVGSQVYDMGSGNLLMKQWQDYVDVDNQLGDGSTVSFTADNLELSNFPTEGFSSEPFDYAGIYEYVDGEWVRSPASNAFNGEPGSYDYGKSPAEYIEVFIGGIRQLSGYSVAFEPLSPFITVTFDVPPPDGQMVTLLVRHGKSWYTPGVYEPSNGLALQETDNPAARFLCGIT